jgi:2-octaprenyl-6-methoxyphenol hydroxylase
LQQAFGWRAGRFYHTGIRQAYPLCLKYVQQFHHARVVLIGNAAHTLHPVAGQGLNLGLRDVASLVDVIIKNQLTGDVGHQKGMQQYERWQQADLKRLTTLTDGLVRLFSTHFWPFTWGRNLGLCLLDGLPPLKRHLVLQMTGLKGHPSRLLRGLPAVNSPD